MPLTCKIGVHLEKHDRSRFVNVSLTKLVHMFIFSYPYSPTRFLIGLEFMWIYCIFCLEELEFGGKSCIFQGSPCT